MPGHFEGWDPASNWSNLTFYARHGDGIGAGARRAARDAGTSFPLGATLSLDGVNFSVFSKHATGVELLLFDRVDDATPARVDRARSATPIAPITTGTCSCPASRRARSTATASTGRSTRPAGCRFDRDKVLLDPYGTRRGRARRLQTARAAAAPGDNARDGDEERRRRSRAPTTGRAIAPLQRPFARTVIYEMHVGGFTRHPSSGVAAGQARHLCRA